MIITRRQLVWVEIALTVWRQATGWTVRGSKTGGDEIFQTHPDRPRGPPSHTYRVPFQRVNRTGRVADETLTSSPRIE